MKSYHTFLTENVQISMAKKAWGSLSHDAQHLINAWEAFNWNGGPLEEAIKRNTPAAQELEAVFAPIRATMPSHVKLWRGRRGLRPDYHATKLLESWTSDRKVAEHFAGRANIDFKTMIYDEITDEEIHRAIDTYRRHNFVTFHGRQYKRNKNNPMYYDIYDSRVGGYVTDGSDLTKEFRDMQEFRRERNAERLSSGFLDEEMIDRNRIMWISNNLNCKEYIVLK